jgi:hypothetical protein
MSMVIEAPHYVLEMTEKQFQDLITEAADANGWLHYHTHDSRRSDPGFPDLVLVKPGHPILFLEVKREKGRVSWQQTAWLNAINAADGDHVIACLVRPSDWPWIALELGKSP